MTPNPALASSAAQLKPAGPDPTTAIFSFRGADFSKGLNPVVHACSTKARWILPIWMAPPGRPTALHSFSHSCDVGHSTPHAPPRMLFCLIVRMAPVTLRNFSFLMKVPGSVPPGHPLEHGASWHSRQRSASAIASPSSKPLPMPVNGFDFFTGDPPATCGLETYATAQLPRPKGPA